MKAMAAGSTGRTGVGGFHGFRGGGTVTLRARIGAAVMDSECTPLGTSSSVSGHRLRDGPRAGVAVPSTSWCQLAQIARAGRRSKKGECRTAAAIGHGGMSHSSAF